METGWARNYRMEYENGDDAVPKDRSQVYTVLSRALSSYHLPHSTNLRISRQKEKDLQRRRHVRAHTRTCPRRVFGPLKGWCLGNIAF